MTWNEFIALPPGTLITGEGCTLDKPPWTGELREVSEEKQTVWIWYTRTAFSHTEPCDPYRLPIHKADWPTIPWKIIGINLVDIEEW